MLQPPWGDVSVRLGQEFWILAVSNQELLNAAEMGQRVKQPERGTLVKDKCGMTGAGKLSSERGKEAF